MSSKYFTNISQQLGRWEWPTNTWLQNRRKELINKMIKINYTSLVLAWDPNNQVYRDKAGHPWKMDEHGSLFSNRHGGFFDSQQYEVVGAFGGKLVDKEGRELKRWVT